MQAYFLAPLLQLALLVPANDGEIRAEKADSIKLADAGGSTTTLLPPTAAATTAAPKVETAREQETRLIMQSIFADVAYLMPKSFERDDFASKPDEVKQHFESLLKATQDLEASGSKQGESFHHLAQHLQTNVKEAKTFYENNSTQKSAFLVQQLSETCFTCHAKYQQRHLTPKPEVFYERIKLSSMRPQDQAKVYVVTRQFNLAQEKYEELLKQQDVFNYYEPIVEQYLSIALGVNHNFEAPLAAFKKLRRSKDIDQVAAQTLDVWISDLEQLSKKKSSLTATLPNMHALIDAAKLRTDHWRDKRGIVYWISALSVLNQLTRETHGAEVDAELYYWLGVTATMFEHSYWVTQMPFYLEKAIRLAPHSEISFNAYQLLKANIENGYTGSAGTNIPADVADKLIELRKLSGKKPKEPITIRSKDAKK